MTETPSTPTRPNWPNFPSSPTAGGIQRASSGRCTRSTRCGWNGSSRTCRWPASACWTSAAAAASCPIRWRARAPRCWASTWPTKALQVAQLHALEANTPNVEYREISAEALAAEQPGSFDAVTCMEMLEHVPDPASVVQRLQPAGQAGRLGVLLHHQPQSQVLPVCHRRRRVRAQAAAARHARIPEVHPAERTGRATAAPPGWNWCTPGEWNTTRSRAAIGCRATPA